MNQSTHILENRNVFLSELRSGKYKKGCIKSDEKGRPVIESPEDDDGSCVCAIMVQLFGGPKSSVPKAVKALGITTQNCRFIQRELNDSPLSFTEIASMIENEIFTLKQ